MIVTAGGAAILGAWEDGALLLFLFSLGHALEHMAMERARKAIEALAELLLEDKVKAMEELGQAASVVMHS